MIPRRMATGLRLCLLLCLALSALFAAQHYGQVLFNGLPVPGAIVMASTADQKLTAVTDTQGLYSFPELSDGAWTLQVEMLGFATAKQEVVAGPDAPPARWELKLLPLDQIQAEIKTAAASVTPAPAAAAEQPKPLTAAPQGPEPSDEGGIL